MKSIATLALAIVLVLAGGTNASAQSPDGQFGVGATISPSLSAAQLQYAITPAVHIGAGLGFGTSDGNSQFVFAPYGKFILAGTKEFKPFALAQLAVIRQSFSTGLSTSSTTTTSLNLGGGAEYFITPNFGVFAAIPVIAIPFNDGAEMSFGILSPTIGVEWFF